LFAYRRSRYNTRGILFPKERIMSAPVKAATLPEVPAEVLSFAAEKGVSEWVYPVLEMTARVFAGCPLRLFVECDYEDSDWQYIVLEADVKGYDPDRLLKAQLKWTRELVASVPAQPGQFFIYGIA
jgi:hypothetical protein